MEATLAVHWGQLCLLRWRWDSWCSFLQASAPPAGQGCSRGSSSLSLGSPGDFSFGAEAELRPWPLWVTTPASVWAGQEHFWQEAERLCPVSREDTNCNSTSWPAFVFPWSLKSCPWSQESSWFIFSCWTQRGMEELWRGAKYPGLSLGDLSSQFTATSIRISRYHGTWNHGPEDPSRTSPLPGQSLDPHCVCSGACVPHNSRTE